MLLIIVGPSVGWSSAVCPPTRVTDIVLQPAADANPCLAAHPRWGLCLPLPPQLAVALSTSLYIYRECMYVCRNYTAVYRVAADAFIAHVLLNIHKCEWSIELLALNQTANEYESETHHTYKHISIYGTLTSVAAVEINTFDATADA